MILFVARVSGHSMQPTFSQNDQLLVSGISYWFLKPKIGDIIVFNMSKKFHIKRIIDVKNNTFFVAGDNPKDSLDSRQFGWIERSAILGKVIKKI